jgi:hypothetical protein
MTRSGSGACWPSRFSRNETVHTGFGRHAPEGVCAAPGLPGPISVSALLNARERAHTATYGLLTKRGGEL